MYTHLVLTAYFPDTPEQQAALAFLVKGHAAQLYLDSLRCSGNVDEACATAGLARRSIVSARVLLPGFREAEDLAKQQFAERLVTHCTTAVLKADPEALLNHPTLPIAAVNWHNPELRPNFAVNVSIDQRQLLITDWQAALPVE